MGYKYILSPAFNRQSENQISHETWPGHAGVFVVSSFGLDFHKFMFSRCGCMGK